MTKHELTVNDLINELEKARQFAFKTNDIKAAVVATMAKAIILGLIPNDRQDLFDEFYKLLREIN